MINILIGVLATVLFFLCLAGAYWLGRKHRKADEVAKLSEQEEIEAEKHLKGMENVLNYDYDVAIGRRKNK